MAEEYSVPEVTAKIVDKKTLTWKPQKNTAAVDAYSLDSKQKGKFYYGIHIATGKVSGAGTNDNGVYVVLIGDQGATSKLYILNFFWFDFGIEEGTCDDLLVETDTSLGSVQAVILGNEKNWFLSRNDNWYVNYVSVYNPIGGSVKQEKKFPCYHWMGDNEAITLTSATTLVKDIENNKILMKQRELELKERKSKYQWQLFPETGVPSGIDDTVDDIPADEQFDRVKNIDFTSDGLEAIRKLGLTGVVTDVNDLFDYAKFSKVLETDEALPLYESCRWTSDVEFGRQMLNGVNPMVIKRCTTIPSKFPVTNDLVKPFLTRGLSLEKEMKEGRIYICDLEIMDGLKAREGCYAPAPICLLYVNSNNDLVPIAIQIRQGVREEEKSLPNPIFVPGDNWMDWILAKVYYQAGHSQLHQTLTHYISCHAAMEAYCVATMRNLPDAHPINKLLHPHFRYTIAINTRARATLINDGGIIDLFFGIGGEGKVELFKRSSKVYQVDITNIQESIKERGLEDVPKFYYRDDGLKLWSIFESFVTSIIDEFYKSDADVANDVELNHWAKDVHTNGFPSFLGSPEGRGFPRLIASKSELIKQCTRIMFTGSCQHAAVNFGQYRIYSYVPNAPFAILQPPPEKKGVATYDSILKTLPDEKTAAASISLMHVLSQYGTNEISIGHYPAERFLESAAVDAISTFATKLDKYADEVTARNATLDMPYIDLLPKRVPNSITI